MMAANGQPQPPPPPSEPPPPTEHPNDAKLREHQANAARQTARYSDFLNVEPASSTEGGLSDTEPMFSIADFGASSMSRGNSSDQANNNPYGSAGFNGFSNTASADLYTNSLGAIHDPHMEPSFFSHPSNGGPNQPSDFGGSGSATPTGGQGMPLAGGADAFALDPTLLTMGVNPVDMRIGTADPWPTVVSPVQVHAIPPTPQDFSRASSEASTRPNGVVPPKAGPSKAPSLPPGDRPTPPLETYDRKGWQNRASTRREELQHLSKAPTRTAGKLAKFLSSFSNPAATDKNDWSTIPIEGRIEVLSTIKKGGNKLFYDAWINAEGNKGLELLSTWLRAVPLLFERTRVHEADAAADKETYALLLFEVRRSFIPPLTSHEGLTFRRSSSTSCR